MNHKKQKQTNIATIEALFHTSIQILYAHAQAHERERRLMEERTREAVARAYAERQSPRTHQAAAPSPRNPSEYAPGAHRRMSVGEVAPYLSPRGVTTPRGGVTPRGATPAASMQITNEGSGHMVAAAQKPGLRLDLSKLHANHEGATEYSQTPSSARRDAAPFADAHPSKPSPRASLHAGSGFINLTDSRQMNSAPQYTADAAIRDKHLVDTVAANEHVGPASGYHSPLMQSASTSDGDDMYLSSDGFTSADDQPYPDTHTHTRTDSHDVQRRPQQHQHQSAENIKHSSRSDAKSNTPRTAKLAAEEPPLSLSVHLTPSQKGMPSNMAPSQKSMHSNMAPAQRSMPSNAQYFFKSAPAGERLPTQGVCVCVCLFVCTFLFGVRMSVCMHLDS